jgi:hypothetical protein
MERTERYDPEDLEQLMLERGFDELLAEERAYALRHLADRAEYERMRSLLLHVRDQAGRSPLEDAAPEVRERVLEAFRAQQQPQWKIWLNSIGVLLTPSRPVHTWRPALALGMVALVSVSAWLVLKEQRPGEKKVLAEVHHTVPAPPVEKPVAPAPESSVEEAEVPETATKSPRPDVDMDQQGTPAPMAPSETQAAAVPASAPAMSRLAEVADSTATATDMPVQQPAVSENKAATSVAEDAATGLMSAKAETAAQPRSRYTDKDKTEKSTLAYCEDDLLGLLQAAW